MISSDEMPDKAFKLELDQAPCRYEAAYKYRVIVGYPVPKNVVRAAMGDGYGW